MQDARFLACSLLFVTFCFGGCQRGPASLTPVSGKVSYKGVALPGGTIVFSPDTARGENGPIAHSKINPDGTFQLATGESSGAAPGKYRVTVISQVAIGKVLPGERFVMPSSLIPEKYSDPELSQVSCDIVPGRSNVFNIDLN